MGNNEGGSYGGPEVKLSKVMISLLFFWSWVGVRGIATLC